MRAEDVIEEAADLIGRNSPCVMTKDEARSLARLVAPLIAKAERERCAKWHAEQVAGEDALAEHAIGADRDAWMYHYHTAATHRESAAAIRALPDE